MRTRTRDILLTIFLVVFVPVGIAAIAILAGLLFGPSAGIGIVVVAAVGLPIAVWKAKRQVPASSQPPTPDDPIPSSFHASRTRQQERLRKRAAAPDDPIDSSFLASRPDEKRDS